MELRVREIKLDLSRAESGVGLPRSAYETLPERDQPTHGVGTEVTAVAADGEVLGICRTLAANDYDASPALSRTCFVAWLGVPPDGGAHDKQRSGQGRGLGKRLLSQSLVQMQRRGFVNSIISTDYNNFRAQTFYTNFGYSVSDWTHSFTKDLSAAGSKLVRPRL
jgi:ribosomal protein S18 acetylase RimI-like enzyme